MKRLHSIVTRLNVSIPRFPPSNVKFREVGSNRRGPADGVVTYSRCIGGCPAESSWKSLPSTW